MDDSVLFDLDDGVLTVTLNEPETMNALTRGISSGIAEALERAKDDSVHVLLLTGNGRGFCAGAAIGVGATGGDGTSNRATKLDQRGASGRSGEAFSRCDKPIIAAVNGASVGAGFGLALCCDVRILGESARMGSIFIRRALASDYGAAYWLPRIVGMSKAYDILYSGDLLDAQACLDCGIASRVVADAALHAEAQALARKLADGPPLAYTVLRRMMQRTHDMDLATFAEYEWTSQRMLLDTHDSKEGFKAFSEKRTPKFSGK